ncbi:hypothetical protein BD310DRAFT_1001029 [Dichomitus squalens]|uniref:Uncharacterized protein n=1 Tax=Dichomitus squalens TaxID=114155 RepID=A0A4Q9PCX0_9APHY|nr:hypothetical protein BD310DRAFT_1001029 [Dichomitus squalens]
MYYYWRKVDSLNPWKTSQTSSVYLQLPNRQGYRTLEYAAALRRVRRKGYGRGKTGGSANPSPTLQLIRLIVIAWSGQCAEGEWVDARSEQQLSQVFCVKRPTVDSGAQIQETCYLANKDVRQSSTLGDAMRSVQVQGNLSDRSEGWATLPPVGHEAFSHSMQNRGSQG